MDAGRRHGVPAASGVYRIVNLRTGCEYIGSAVNLAGRRRQHRHALERGSHVNRRLQKAWARDGAVAFRFEVIELAHRDVLLAREQAHLDAPHAKGRYNVLLVAGAGPGALANAATRAKMRAAKVGRQLSAEHKANIGAGLRGRVIPPETRAKVGAAQRGVPKTEAHKARLRTACSGWSHDSEARAEIARAARGRPCGESTRALRREAARRQMASADARRRISDANTGRKHSDEARTKMRAAWAKRKAGQAAAAG